MQPYAWKLEINIELIMIGEAGRGRKPEVKPVVSEDTTGKPSTGDAGRDRASEQVAAEKRPQGMYSKMAPALYVPPTAAVP